MGALLGISLWFVLATVIPGLISIAVICCSFVFSGSEIMSSEKSMFLMSNDWIIAGLAVAVMILTQALGILLEELIIKFHLFPGCRHLTVPEEFCSDKEKEIDAYSQYAKLYILLARLKENEDTQGHLKRTTAQFFLTINTMISFMAGIVISFVLFYKKGGGENLMYYIAGLFLCLIISYWVAVIRFQVMAKCIWAAHAVRE